MDYEKNETVYESEGYVERNTGVMVGLIVGVSVATLVLIFMGVLGGQVYQQTESDINAINDTTIKQYVKDSITSGFKAQKLTGNYLPIIVLAVVIFVVLGLVTGLGGGASYGGYEGAL